MSGTPSQPTFPGSGADVTPNDDTVFTASAIRVGTAGTVAVVTATGQSLTITTANDGEMLPVLCTKVLATGTSGAANIQRFW